MLLYTNQMTVPSAFCDVDASEHETMEVAGTQRQCAHLSQNILFYLFFFFYSSFMASVIKPQVNVG